MIDIQFAGKKQLTYCLPRHFDMGYLPSKKTILIIRDNRRSLIADLVHESIHSILCRRLSVKISSQYDAVYYKIEPMKFDDFLLDDNEVASTR